MKQGVTKYNSRFNEFCITTQVGERSVDTICKTFSRFFNVFTRI